ncbi:MAG: hypothetical protein IKM98_09970 [Bacteroidales bacterium]|nr:hypothetical protein [Bacteroidales bacterium]
MKVKIEYAKGETSKEDLMALQSFIERKKIKGVSKVGLATQRPKKGEMGAGIASALTALIGSATEPLTTLAMALVEWVKLERSEIRLVGTSGAEICISGKVKDKDLQNALEKFFTQEKANVKAGAKRASRPTPPPPPQGQQPDGNK